LIQEIVRIPIQAIDYGGFREKRDTQNRTTVTGVRERERGKEEEDDGNKTTLQLTSYTRQVE